MLRSGDVQLGSIHGNCTICVQIFVNIWDLIDKSVINMFVGNCKGAQRECLLI